MKTNEWKYRSSILNLDTRCWYEVSFTPMPIQSSGNSPQKFGSPPEPVRKLFSREEFLVPVGNRTPAIQTVTRRCTYWAIPAPNIHIFTYLCIRTLSVLLFAYAHRTSQLYNARTYVFIYSDHVFGFLSQLLFMVIYGNIHIAYLDRRGMMWRENGENFITRSFVICILC
jgi:hypothetical protein